MRLQLILASGLVAVTNAAGTLGKDLRSTPPYQALQPSIEQAARLDSAFLIAQNDKTAKYIVNGTAIPEVDFDIGESYAGLMPIGRNRTDELFFWFFPTEDEAGKDTVTIWLNGGPYCSSLTGLLTENGPFLWLEGTEKPIRNSWRWSQITNMIWVEQPVGTGFAQGTPTADNEEEIAQDFLGFFRNLIDTFGLHGKKIYITGESYAGLYIPYIADAMYAEQDDNYFNLKGTLLVNVLIGTFDLQQHIPTVTYADQWPGIFTLNSTASTAFHELDARCGHKEYLKKHLTYPPPTPFAPAPDASGSLGCDEIWGNLRDAMIELNPCFDHYHITTTCPQVTNPLPQGPGPNIYFNLTDVQRAINAPVQEWLKCNSGPLDIDDKSAPSAWEVYPRVIEQSERTVLVHGTLDYILQDIGLRLAVQNMTWGGKQGFQEEPKDRFYVPVGNGDPNKKDALPLSGFGELGITHTERGLTWVENFGAGHMVPRDQPAAGFRQLEYLLGRVDKLTE